MQLILTIIASTLASVLWFYLVINICKRTVGKDANIWQITGCLLIAGPIGWGTILIIIGYDIVDNISKFIQKKRK